MAYLTHLSTPRSSAPLARDESVRVDGRATLPWPDELLTLFSLRMSSHGMSISRIDMQCDARYALQQLHDARHMGDATLTSMADALFRFFESHQSGLSGHSH